MTTTTISNALPSQVAPVSTPPSAPPAVAVHHETEAIGKGLLGAADRVQQAASPGLAPTGVSAGGAASRLAAPPTLPPPPATPTSAALSGAAAQLNQTTPPSGRINLFEAVQLYYMTTLDTRTQAQDVMDAELQSQVSEIDTQAKAMMKSAKLEMIGGIVGGVAGMASGILKGVGSFKSVGIQASDAIKQATMLKWTSLGDIGNALGGDVPKSVLNFESQKKSAESTEDQAQAERFQAAFGETQTYRQDMQSNMNAAASAIEEFMQAQASVASKIFA